MNVWRRRQVAQDEAERMIGPYLIVAVGDDEEDGEHSNAPAEETEQFERGTVGPMGIFGDNDYWPGSGGEDREHLAEEPVTGVAVEGC